MYLFRSSGLRNCTLILRRVTEKSLEGLGLRTLRTNRLLQLYTYKKPKIGCFVRLSLRLNNSYEVQKKGWEYLYYNEVSKNMEPNNRNMGMSINNYATEKTTIAWIQIKTNICLTDKSNLSWSRGSITNQITDTPLRSFIYICFFAS